MSASGEKKYQFMKQQGFQADRTRATESHFDLLLFQPILVGSAVVVAIVFQSSVLFMVLGGILWFNTIFPGLNPFERFLDLVTGKTEKRIPLPPAPAPRRFMQGMAGTLMLLVAVSMSQGYTYLAYALQGFVAVAFSLLLFGKFCVGAYIYHVLTGNTKFANQTCPWSEGE